MNSQRRTNDLSTIGTIKPYNTVCPKKTESPSYFSEQYSIMCIVIDYKMYTVRTVWKRYKTKRSASNRDFSSGTIAYKKLA
jgi:hypothetical protein